MTAPIVGGDLWRAVISAAGYRCECKGQCGKECSRPHSKDPSRRTWDGRCRREQQQGSAFGITGPLHAVTREPAGPVATMAAQSVDLIAVCEPCHGGILRAREREAKKQAADLAAQADKLF